jgi:hypothetical protein
MVRIASMIPTRLGVGGQAVAGLHDDITLLQAPCHPEL